MPRQSRNTIPAAVFGRPGRYVLSRLVLAREVLRLLMMVLKSVWLERGRGRVLVASTVNKQIRFTGVDAFPLISQIAVLVGLLVGMVIVQLANPATTRQWADDLQRVFIELSTTTISPMLITLIVIARSGTAISTELGTMKIRNEMQVFDALGVNIYYLVIWPRILGMVISLVSLTIYFNLIMVLTHFLFVDSFAVTDSVKSLSHLGSASFINLIQAVTKTAVIGLGISTIACYFGLSAKRSFTEVPQVATKGVVNSIIFSVIANVLIFFLFNALFGFQFNRTG